MRYGMAATALLGATLAACGNGSIGGNGGGVDGGSADLSVADGAITGGGDLASAGGDAAMPAADTLDANRDRLLASYLAYLKAHPGAQSNGLDAATVGGVCDLWPR